MSRDRYKYLKYSRNLYQNISKKKDKKLKSMKKYTNKIFLKKTNKKKKGYIKEYKKLIQCLKKIKETMSWKALK